MYARPIQQLIAAFSKLPGVGPRTAERYVFFLLKSGKQNVAALLSALQEIMTEIKSCMICYDFSDESPCHRCRDRSRDQTSICVVAEPSDIETLERTRAYSGLYHVLRGTIDASDIEQPKQLKTAELIARLSPNVHEVILALSPDSHGEVTMLYLERAIRSSVPTCRITRLARGLPLGSDLRYADDITLSSALKHRTSSP